MQNSTIGSSGRSQRDAAYSAFARAAIAVALAIGAWLRLDQFGAQVLIDDEWHVVHQVMLSTPREMLIDFGYSDYGIPLGLLGWVESRTVGVSETVLRLPMLVCGLVTLLGSVVYVARRFTPATTIVFAWLLAASPLMVIYSRMARPYAITLLLGWTAHAAFQRFWGARRGADSGCAADDAGGNRAALLYGGTAAFSTWLHPIVAPFVLAPLVWGAVAASRTRGPRRRERFVRLARVAVPTGAAIAALVLPPLIANPISMTLKSGVDSPNLDTLVGALHAWLGTPSVAVVVGCVALAALGARDVMRTLPEARTATLGVVLTFGAIVVSRPAWSYNAISVARYLLPFLPLLLLAVAAGAIALARRIGIATWPRRLLAGSIALAPCAALAMQSPWPEMLRTPNGHTLHLVHHFDFRPEHNAYLPYIERIPLSAFWTSLAAAPRASLRVAAAPFHFESYNWDAPRWERLSGQVVVPGFLTGLCVAQRFGETPMEPGFRLRNAVHLADAGALARQRIDFVVWQKPFDHVVRGERQTVGVGVAHCETVLRERFGPPVYEDGALVAFRLRAARTDVDAAR